MKRKPGGALSAESLIKTVSICSKNILDETTRNKPQISLHDNILSAIAIFKLKYPSLLQFDNDRQDPAHAHNLKTLFHVDQAPSDTALRERLDLLEPHKLRKIFSTLFSVAQRNKVLEDYYYLSEGYLCSIDGTGCFHSETVHCENCCEKKHRDGSTSYYHQMLCGVIVHPNRSHVIPLCPEPILKQDGSTKNDCERNASKRFLTDLKREHPHLKLVILEDSLASNAPHIRLIEELGYQYIIGAKPGDHKWLFDWVGACSKEVVELTESNRNQHRLEFVNNVPLNESNEDVRVNFLEHWESRPNGKVIHHTWVSNILLTKDNVFKVMEGGRTRWKVENETLNTLKTQGYHFEHNFGHGEKNLSTVFSFIMMIAFLIDELGFIGCHLMQQTRETLLGKKRMWQKIRSAFDSYFITCWEDLFDFFIGKVRKPPLPANTS
jgi:hypothetical protein